MTKDKYNAIVVCIIGVFLSRLGQARQRLIKTSQDEDLIAAYGIGVKVVTVKERDVAVVKKMDRVLVQSDRYTINEVFPVYLNDLLVGWRCVIRGK